MENQRTRLTKRLIEDAFIQLLRERPIGKISVKEICVRSQINRSTFYSYYLDPYDLLEYTQNKAIAPFLDYVKTHRKDAFERKNLLALCKTLREEKDFLNVFVNGNGCYNFNRRFVIALSDAWNADVRFSPNEKTYYYLGFYLVGFFSVLQEWLRNDCVYPEEGIAEIFLDLYKQNEPHLKG